MRLSRPTCEPSGWYAFVVTNQAGVARGYYDEAAVRRFHEQMELELACKAAHVDEFVIAHSTPTRRWWNIGAIRNAESQSQG